jgi:predicted alpha/beta-hydrolase family hydrolase
MVNRFETFEIVFDASGRPGRVTARRYASASSEASAWFVVAHGAGAGQHHPFMVRYAEALAGQGIEVLTFNFPYIEAGRRVPDQNGMLEACARGALVEALQRAGGARLFAGGKSMGGRILSQVVAADQELASTLAGLVFLGYPLHPPGRPDRPRTGHWPTLYVPSLFVQGSRDPFASPEELRAALPAMAGRAEVHIVDDGDHSFAVRKGKGRTQTEVDTEVQRRILDWMRTAITDASARRP